MNALSSNHRLIVLLLFLMACGDKETKEDRILPNEVNSEQNVAMNAIDSVGIEEEESFKLFNPKIDSAKFDFTSDYSTMIHRYLNRYYKSDSIEVIKYSSQEADYMVCGFKQSFEFGIQYYLNMCGEAGSREDLTIPKIDKQQLISLLEELIEIDYTVSYWNNDSTIMNTDDVGCFIEIIEQEQTWKVTVICTC